MEARSEKPVRLNTHVGQLHASDHARVHVGNSYSVNEDPEKVRKEFLRRLNVSPYEDRKDRNPTRADGTCDWFTSHHLFRNWQSESSSGLLWVSADPGCGKSVLSKYLIDDIIPTDSSRTTCYFFFKDDFEDQKLLENALSCILHQLFVQHPSLLQDSFVKEYEEQGIQMLASFRALWSILNRAVNQHKTEIVCILDALDECTDGKPLISALTQLYQQPQRSSNLKFLITSRPYEYIGRDFRLIKEKYPTVHLSGESQEEVDKISKEITSSIKQRVQALGDRIQLGSKERAEIMERMLSVDHRTYLWVHLVLAVIEEAIVVVAEDWQTALDAMPRTVEEAYQSILQKSRDPEKAFKILQLVVAADRPLSLTEMVAALAVSGKQWTSHKDLASISPAVDRLQNAIREACGLFVIVKNSRIFLLHQTAREFLIRGAAQKTSPLPKLLTWKGKVDIFEAHYLLANICLRYLSSIAKYEELHTTLKDESLRATVPLLDYAAVNWTDHYREVQDHSDQPMTFSAAELCEPGSSIYDLWVRLYRAAGRGAHRLAERLRTKVLIASYFGLHNLVQTSLQNQKSDLDIWDPDHLRTPLSLACEKGYLLVAEAILQYIPRHKVIARSWTRRYSTVTKPDVWGRAPIHYAAIGGHYDIARALVDKGVSINGRDNNGLTPLALATFEGHDDIVQLLLKSGAKAHSLREYLETPDSRGRVPLLRAVHNQDSIALQMLIDQGAQVNVPCREGSPLLLAVWHCSEECLRILLDGGAELETRDLAGLTTLNLVANLGHGGMMNALLDRGANVNSRDYDGNTALMSVLQRRNFHLIPDLLRHGADPNVTYEEHPLLIASITINTEVTHNLLDHGANPNVWDSNGNSALYIAVSRGYGKLALALLKHGADIESRNKQGETALYLATQTGKAGIVGDLLECGADPNVYVNSGDSALAVAISEGYDEIAYTLLHKGARPEARNKQGRTALSLAVQARKFTLVKDLLERGADPNALETLGASVLLLAASQGYNEMVRTLLTHGAEVDRREGKGRTALLVASEAGKVSVVKELLEHGAEIDACDSRGWTPLMAATGAKRLEIVELLIERGADMDIQTPSGFTAMSIAGGFGMDAVAQLLRAKGAL